MKLISRFTNRKGQPRPLALSQSAELSSAVDRREFLALASAFGATTATAYSMLGMATPAQAATPVMGGTMRFEVGVRALKDTRTMDFAAMAMVAPNWLKYLAEYNNDGAFQPRLLPDWSVNDDATVYIWNVRRVSLGTTAPPLRHMTLHAKLSAGVMQTSKATQWRHVLNLWSMPRQTKSPTMRSM